jgi:hypothetical protein
MQNARYAAAKKWGLSTGHITCETEQAQTIRSGVMFILNVPAVHSFGCMVLLFQRTNTGIEKHFIGVK